MALRSVICDVPSADSCGLGLGSDTHRRLRPGEAHCLSQRDEIAETSKLRCPAFLWRKPIRQAYRGKKNNVILDPRIHAMLPGEQMKAIMSESARWKENRIRQEIYKGNLKHIRTPCTESVGMTQWRGQSESSIAGFLPQGPGQRTVNGEQ